MAQVDGSLDGIDWARLKADLAADDFDNGRSPDALRRSFERSAHVAIARDGDRSASGRSRSSSPSSPAAGWTTRATGRRRIPCPPWPRP
jgi:hypothetical protein